MHYSSLEVVYEDNHLLVINKSAGLATQGAAAGKQSLLELAKQYLKQRYHKPGNVYLGTVSRLDASVSGVVVFARTSKAAARLTEQFREHTVRKVYWAVVSGRPAASGACGDWLIKDERRQRMTVAAAGTAGAQLARLAYRRLQPVPDGWLLEIELETGRKHQIRVQLAARHLPIFGDRKYGSQRPFAGIALHSRLLEFKHPTRGETVTLVAPLPASWRQFGLTRITHRPR